MAFQAGAIVSQITLDRSKFSASIKTVQKQTKTLGGWVKKNSRQFKAMGLVIAAMGTAALLTFKKMVKQYVEVGDMVHKMALRTGFAATTLSELAYAAEISGADISMLEKGVKKMSKTIVDASYGLETYLRVFRSLGLEVEDLLALSPEEQFFKIGNAIAEMESDTLRTAAAVDVFGRSGTMLLPFFKEGAEGIAKLRKEAHTLGIIFDEEAAAKAAALKDAQTALTGSVKGLSIAIVTDLIPVITEVTKGFTDWFVKSREGAGDWTQAILGFFRIIGKGIQALMLAWHGLQVVIFKGAEFAVKSIKLQIDTLLLPFKLLAKLPGYGELIKPMLKAIGKHTADLTTISEGYNEAAGEQIKRIEDIVIGFESFFTMLGKVSGGLKDTKEETKAFSTAIPIIMMPVSEAWEKLMGDSKELTLAWEQHMVGMEEKTQNFVSNLIISLGGWAEGYEGTTERIKTANELLMESWNLTTEAQLTFTQAALGEFVAMEASLKGFVDAILGTLEKWAIGEVIPKIMAALPFPLNLLAVGGATLAIKAFFKGIRGMEEGGVVEQEGPHYLHAGEVVVPAEVVRGTTGMTKMGPGPFHTTVNQYIYPQRLDERAIDQIATKMHAAIKRQERRY